MKIVHFCLSSFFNDGLLYQENELVREHVHAGHEVLVVASTEVFDDGGHITYTDPCDYIGAEGARVIRLPYRRWLPAALGRKVRSYPGVRAILEDFVPEAIMFHGSAAWELLTVARHVRDNAGIVFHIDSHSDEVNSGQRAFSREFLHKRFYAPILRRAMTVSGPLLCVSLSVMDFANEVYRIPRERLEFYPLGGRILNRETRDAMRVSVRHRLGVRDEDILIVQSGKQNRLKKLPQSLRALAQVQNPELRLVIAGVLQEDVRAECEALIAEDPRVTFLGWQEPGELTELLCAADVYLQPGTQSATMQHSLCCGCAVILDAVAAHKPYVDGNGWLVSSPEDLRDVLSCLATADLIGKNAASLSLAERMLNYAALAKRILG
jgi:1,2-diacylglycerol 3-alpha-glucosyltransferase